MTLSFPLATDRLLIEPMTVRDAEAFAAYRSDPAIARFQSWDTPYAVDTARKVLLANPQGWPPAGGWTQLALREGDELRGDVGVHALDDPIARDTIEVGVTVLPGAQHRGLATEALRAVIGACFEGGAHRVFAGCDARNAPVGRLLERVGMRHEARLLEAEWWKDEWTTADTWAVLAAEWRG